VLVLVLVVMLVHGWSSAANLEGHVTAGAQMIAEALMRRGEPKAPSLDVVQEMLPGFGHLESLRIHARCRVLGQTLSELNLRGRTGASIVAIARGKQGILTPRGDEVLREDDEVALTGSQEAVESARKLLEESVT
jgi:CPA2 family monovalent cation:H+ antiporter-2